MTFIVYFTIEALCLFLVAAYAGLETGFISIDQTTLSHMLQDTKAVTDRKLLQTLKHPERFLTLTLIGTNLTMVLAAAIWTELLQSYFPSLISFGSLAMSIVILIFCEMLPKMLFAAQPLAMTKRLLPLINISEWVLAIPITLVTWFLRSFMKIIGTSDKRRSGISREELLILLGQGARAGILRERPTRMAHGIIGLKELRLCDIMMPRIKITALDVNLPITQARKLVMESGYSRLPVYEGTIDQIIGIVYFKDLYLKEPKPTSLREILSPPIFAPESKNAFEQLQEMRRKNYQAVIVVDEFGSFSGLVTLEDLLEEVFGEIEDELDEPVTTLKSSPDGSFIAPAEMKLTDFARETGIAFNETMGTSTLNGLISAFSGKIPQVGEVCKIDGIKIEILQADPRRVIKIRVTAPASTINSVKK